MPSLIRARIGQRISDLRLIRTGERIEAAKTYTVAGWASVNEGTEGPAGLGLLMRHIELRKVVRLRREPLRPGGRGVEAIIRFLLPLDARLRGHDD